MSCTSTNNNSELGRQVDQARWNWNLKVKGISNSQDMFLPINVEISNSHDGNYVRAMFCRYLFVFSDDDKNWVILQTSNYHLER